jgi:hypothetical protein
MEKIRLHSMTDLITNSSTTIYTYSDASPKALEEMVNEFFSAFGIKHKCSDVFNMILMPSSVEDYLEDYILNNYPHDDGKEDKAEEPSLYDEEDTDYEPPKFCPIPREFRNKKTSYRASCELIKNIISGTVEPPEWFYEISEKLIERHREYSGNTLYILPKKPEYKKLAKLVKNFLYSTESEEGCS